MRTWITCCMRSVEPWISSNSASSVCRKAYSLCVSSAEMAVVSKEVIVGILFESGSGGDVGKCRCSSIG